MPTAPPRLQGNGEQAQPQALDRRAPACAHARQPDAPISTTIQFTSQIRLSCSSSPGTSGPLWPRRPLISIWDVLLHGLADSGGELDALQR